jgi:hypothetical protein
VSAAVPVTIAISVAVFPSLRVRALIRAFVAAVPLPIFALVVINTAAFAFAFTFAFAFAFAFTSLCVFVSPG